MKKLVLLAVIAMGTVFTAKAQADSQLIQFGVKGGVNFASVTGDNFNSPDSRTSFNAGFIAEVPFTDRFSIQPEVLYSGQGFDVKESFAGTDFKAEYQLDYIQIPVLAKIYLFEGLNVQAGPQIGFKVNEKIDYDTPIGDGDVDISDENSEVQDFDFGLAAGLEYKFDNGLFVQGRYNYGFSKLIKDQDVHNSVFQAGVGFMF